MSDEIENFVVYRGEKGIDLDFYLVHENTKRPFDLTGVTEISVKIPGETATLTRLYSLAQVSIIDNAKLGHISVPLTDVETLLLATGENQNVSITVTYGAGDIRKSDAIGILNVLDQKVS